MTAFTFDVRTAFLVLALLGMLQALGSWIALRMGASRSSLSTAQRLWILGGLAAALMAAVISMRSTPATLGNLLLSHVFMMIWLVLSWASMKLELDESPRWTTLPLSVLGSVAIYAMVLHLLPENRSLIYPVLTAIIGSVTVAVQCRRLVRAEGSAGAWMMTFSFSLTATVLLARGISVLLSDAPASSISTGATQVLMAMGGVSIFVFGQLGFLGLQYERLVRARIHAEQSRARAEERSLQSQERERSLQRIIDERNLLIRRLQTLDAAQQMALVAAAFPHELRQPLTALRLNLDVLMRECAREPGKPSPRLLASLDRDTQRLGSVIDELATLMRGQETNEPMDAVNLVAVAREAMDVIAPRMQVYGIDLQYKGPENAMVHGKSTPLGQVLLILLANAIDAIADLEAPRSVELSIEDGEGSTLLRVRDNGTGIPEHLRPHLFQPFASEKDQGRGIGLALARRLAQQCDAELALGEARLDMQRPGAEFTLKIPTIGAAFPPTGSKQAAAQDS